MSEIPEAEQGQPVQIDLMVLLSQALSPCLGTVLQSMMHHMGPHAIPAVAGVLGKVLLPYRQQLKSYDPTDMPGPLIEFYNGLAAVVNHTAQIQEEKQRQVILPHEEG